MPTPTAENKFFIVSSYVENLNVRSTGENLGSENDLGGFNLVAGDVIHAIGVVTVAGITYHKFDRIIRDAIRYDYPFNGFPVHEPSPTSEYWTAEKGASVWMTETIDPEPTLPREAILDITVTDPRTGITYGKQGIKLPEVS